MAWRSGRHAVEAAPREAKSIPSSNLQQDVSGDPRPTGGVGDDPCIGEKLAHFGPPGEPIAIRRAGRVTEVSQYILECAAVRNAQIKPLKAGVRIEGRGPVHDQWNGLAWGGRT